MSIQSIADSVVQPLHDFWVAILAAIVNVFTSLLILLQDFFLWILDVMLGLAASLLGATNLNFLTTGLTSFAQLPDAITNILGLIGLGQCLALIGSAILVRVGLQLIPFTRLGS
jgi:hypothetical protein